MLALDWNRMDESRASLTLQQMGIEDMRPLSIAELLDRLQLGSDAPAVENWPAESLDLTHRLNIRPVVDELLRGRVIKDINGTHRPWPGSRVYFPTLVMPQPREYLRGYVQIAGRLRQEYGLDLYILLEDRLSVIKHGWDLTAIRRSVKVFRDYFQRLEPSCTVLVSSEMSAGIPRQFARQHLAKVSGDDLFSILPWRMRGPAATRILDVAHFAWMCYISRACPGIHLVGANNKRHYQIFRSRVAGERLTALLFALGSEQPAADGANGQVE